MPDVAAIDKVFDYLVPAELALDARKGTRVRVRLSGRNVDGWILEDRVEPTPGIEARPVLSLKGLGPPPDVVDLAVWASWRWAGHVSRLLVTASPPLIVRELPEVASRARGPREPSDRQVEGVAREAVAACAAVVRLPPAANPLALVEAVCSVPGGGGALVLAPSQPEASSLAARLREKGWPVALMPGEWAAAAAGGRVIVGSRAAAWAPLPSVDAVVVLDAHDDAYQEERAPTWVAWVVAAERAARAGAPCVLVSACPTAEMLSWGTLLKVSRRAERAGWAPVELVDRSRDDPRTGLLSARLVPLLRSATLERRVVCVLNRKGRGRVLACGACMAIARCESCSGPMAQMADEAVLRCMRCGVERPLLCARCGSVRMRTLRPGVTRLRADLEALVSAPVTELTSSSPPSPVLASVVVGTEAVLHRVPKPAAVVFVDFDSELLAPTYEANERAMALLARASRAVGGRFTAGAGGRGRLVVQTRMPGHEVLVAAVHADPGRLATCEAGVRRALRLPPHSALARVSGEGAGAFVASLAGGSVEVAGDGRRWMVRAPDHGLLADALAAGTRSAGQLRVEVDPRRP